MKLKTPPSIAIEDIGNFKSATVLNEQREPQLTMFTDWSLCLTGEGP